MGQNQLFMSSADVLSSGGPSRLVVLGFADPAGAQKMRDTLEDLESINVLEAEDMVVVTRDQLGQVQLHQQTNLSLAGATFGSFLGLLLGMVFMNPPVGAALGLGIGALSGKLGDMGLDDGFMRELGATLRPGTSALFVLVRRSKPDLVLEGLKAHAGKARIIQTTMTRENEQRLRGLLERTSSQQGNPTAHVGT